MFGSSGNTGFNFQTPTTTSAFGAAPFGQTNSFGSSLFGQANTQPQQSGVFGSQPQTQQQQQQPQSTFGASSFNFASPVTSNTFGSPAFGQTQPASNPSGFSFTSPSAAPNQSLFGSTGFAAQTNPVAPQPTSGLAFGTTAQPAQQSLFGQQPTSGSLFGQTSTASTFGQSSGSLFAAKLPTTTTISSGFGTFNTATPSYGVSTVPNQTPFGSSIGASASNAQPSSASGTGFNFGSTTFSAPSSTFVAPTSSLTTPASSTGFSLGTPASNSTVQLNLSTPVAPVATVPSFNLAPSTSLTSFPTSSTLPSFGTVAPQTTSTTATNTLTTTATTGFNFGSLSSTSLTTPSAPSATFTLNLAPKTSLLSTTTQSIGFGTSALSTNFGATTTTSSVASSTSLPVLSTSLTSSVTTQATPSISLATSGTSLKPNSGFVVTSLGSSTVAPKTTAPTTSIPQITFGKLEDQINIWMNELAQFESDFHSQGQTINSWDSLLISNGQKLTEMNQTIEKLNSAHRGLDHQLDFIIAQQKELEQLLNPIEHNKCDLSTNNVNAEREHTYSLVEIVHNDLNAIGSDLKDFIKKLNETKSNQDSNDPIVQISKILNSHMDVLQWIENQMKNVKVN